MKKKLVMLLIGLMLMTNLAGCSDSDASNRDDQEISDNDDKEESEKSSEDSEFTEEDETSSEELDKDEEVDKDEAFDKEEEKLGLGTISGNSYESAYFKIAWTAPNSNWQLLSREQVDAVYNATLSQLGPNYAELVEKAEVFYDMVAIDQTTYDNINVVVQNMDLSNKIYSETDYVTMSVSSVKALYTQFGYTNVSVRTSTVDIMGQTHACIVSQYDVNDSTQYQIQCCVKIDNYMIVITATSATSTEKCVEILEEFYLLEAL